MVSFQAIIYIALSANVALSFPTRPSDNDNSDQLVRRKWPIQPTDILICKNNIGDKKNPNWVDIDIHVSAAECAVHSAPVMNGGTPSDYPHEFTNGKDPTDKERKKYRFAPFKFPNPRCNKVGEEFREFPLLAVQNKKNKKWNYPPYQYNNKPRENPGPVRIIYTVKGKEFCGVIAHEVKNEDEFHLCRTDAEWKEIGWTRVNGKNVPPAGESFPGEKGPKTGWTVKRRRSPSPENAADSLVRRAPACPMSTCPKGQATVGKDDKCQKCPAGQVPNAAQDQCQKCPAGQKPNATGDDCIKGDKKCGAGEAKIGKDGACKKCPEDQEPSSTGDKCEKKCGSNEVRKGNKCDKCPAGKKPDSTKSKCIDKSAEEKKKEEEERKKKENNEKKKKEEEEKKKKEAEKNKEREKKSTRMGKCMAWMSGNTFLMSDSKVEPLTKEEIAELDDAEDWPAGVPYVEGDITEANIENPPARVVGIEMETAGLGGVFKGIGELFKSIFRSGKKGPAPTRAQVLSKKFDTIKSKKAWRDCLMLKSTSIGGGYLHFDPPGGYTPVHDVDGKRPYLYIYEHEDNRPTGGIRYWAHTDKKFHTDRLLLNQCVNLPEYMNDKATGFDAHKVCCHFYRDADCKDMMFSAKDRQDGELTGNENDVMSSFKCTTMADNCRGL